MIEVFAASSDSPGLYSKPQTDYYKHAVTPSWRCVNMISTDFTRRPSSVVLYNVSVPSSAQLVIRSAIANWERQHGKNVEGQ